MKNIITYSLAVIAAVQLAILINNDQIMERQRDQLNRCTDTIQELVELIEKVEELEVENGFLRTNLDSYKASNAENRETKQRLIEKLEELESTVVTPATDIQSLQNQLLDALVQVESGGDSNAIGDGGKAIGCLQIWKIYWQDATEFSGLGGAYQDCTDPVYARRVVDAYMRRYAKEAWTNPATFDAEKCARIHNGGPRGHKKKATDKYWAKVARQLGL